jgi:hypothetical protein
MSLSEVIRQHLAEVDPPPPNEAATCDWIIVPLLKAVGYRAKEIVPKDADTTGQFPDYTILPDGPYTWYLEAKRWDDSLKDRYAHQSLNYANQNGRRWVVLTNGRTWRLYDNRIQGVADHKLVAAMQLDDIAEAERFLCAIGKASVTSGDLERFAIRSRMRTVLPEQLQDPASKLARDLCKSLKAFAGLSNLLPEDVAAYFGAAPVPPPPPPTSPPGSSYGLDTLATQAQDYVTGRKPASVALPDGIQEPVSTWVDLAVAVVTWLVKQQKLPTLPFCGRKGGNRYFLNSEPNHKNMPMSAGRFQTLRVDDQVIYLHTHRSGADLVACLCAACREMGVLPGAILVALRA